MATSENMEGNEEKSFAELFEQTPVRQDFRKPGQKVEVKIVKITNDGIFLDLGGKSEGYLERKELQDAEGNLSVQEGDLVQAHFLATANQELRFTTRIAGGDAGRQYLLEAWENGIPVEGLVAKEIKGGFEIKLAGDLRAFCPYSQTGLQRAGSPADLIGQHLPFRITQYDEKGRNIVVSHRVILEEERQKQREALKQTLREGTTVTGTISAIRSFGAFVRVDCIEGLIPISALGWARVEDIAERLYYSWSKAFPRYAASTATVRSVTNSEVKVLKRQ